MGRLQAILPRRQIDTIIGSMLGDARLECRSVGTRHPVSARLRIHQSDKQKEYVFWKFSELENLTLRGPRKVKTWHDPERNKDHFSWYFHTKTLIEFGELYHYFYRDNVKVLPDTIFEFLTPKALAVWFMDDGSNTGNGFTISTHCFPKIDQTRIVAFFREAYGILATIVKDRDQFKIGIGKHERLKFIEIVQPFIIPSMEYKICDPRNDFAARTAGANRCDVITA